MRTPNAQHSVHKTLSLEASASLISSNATTSNQNLYDQLFTAIQQTYLSDFLGSDNQLQPTWQFQFPNPAALQVANWVTSVNNNFQAYEMFEVGDLAPISKQGSYLTSPNSPSIYTAYGNWLNTLIPADAENLQAYQNAQNQAAQDATDMQDAIAGAGPAFATWQQDNPGSTITTVEAWLSQVPPLPQAQPFANNYQSAQSDSATQTALMDQLTATADAPLSAALAAYNDKANQTTYPVAPNVSVTAGLGIVGTPDGTENPAQDWLDWSTGKPNPDLNFFTATVAAGVQPVSSVEEVTLTETQRFSFFFGLLSFSITEQVNFFETITTDANFQLQMNWQSLFMYPISRIGWFDQSFLQNHANDPLSASNTTDFFSDTNGVLYLVPSFVFLGWNPTLQLTLSTSLYEQWTNQINSPQGVWFNGIEVTGPPTSVTTGANGTTVVQYGSPKSATAMANLPNIVGYVHLVPTGTP